MASFWCWLFGHKIVQNDRPLPTVTACFRCLRYVRIRDDVPRLRKAA